MFRSFARAGARPAGLVLAALGCLAAAPAPASGVEAISPAFGNTIVSTYPDGRTGHLWLKADGSYGYEGRRKTPSSGRWTLKGAKLCLKQSKPKSIPFSYCPAIRTGGVGTTWPGKAPTGEAIQLKLVAGIVR
jgi:hypothetical protein